MTQRILLATVLKRADDVRMTKKMGQTLQQAGYEVGVLGHCGKGDLHFPEGIKGFPVYGFSRLSPRRLLAGFALLKAVFSFKPNLLIVGAVELLPMVLAIHFFSGKRIKVAYDVREDYIANILYQTHYPRRLRRPLAQIINVVQKLPGVSHYFLAEKSYVQSLTFLKSGKFSVLENKVLLKEEDISARGLCLKNHSISKNNFLLCGTFTPTYGTLEGIRFFKKIQAENPEYALRLQLVGYAPELAYRKQLEAEATSNIEISALDKPVAHATILKAMKGADVLLLPYAPNASTANCFPTKCYEACALQLPMLMQQNPFWKTELEPFNVAVFTDFFKENAIFDFASFVKHDFHPQPVPPSFWSWDFEAEKLLQVMKKLF